MIFVRESMQRRETAAARRPARHGNLSGSQGRPRRATTHDWPSLSRESQSWRRVITSRSPTTTCYQFGGRDRSDERVLSDLFSLVGALGVNGLIIRTFPAAPG